MDPFRYRKAYEAMIHMSQMVEKRCSQALTSEVSETEASAQDPVADETQPPIAQSSGTEQHLEQDDSDGMEWTPTGVETPPAAPNCEPPSTSARSIRNLLPDAREGEYQLEDTEGHGVILHKMQEGLIMDECIEKLIQDLPDVLSYDNSASFTPSTIEVPKDFGLQLSISINHHLAQVADRKILEKYRRLLGHKKDPAKRKTKLGFDPTDLIRKQAVTFSEDAKVRSSSLDNEIHPIFRPENFHGCPDDIYAILKPALRLATQFLFSRGTASFWHTLVFGERKPCPETSERYGQECWRIKDDVAFSEERAATFKSFLDDQVGVVHFFFHRDPLPPDPAYASMGLVADYKNGMIRKLNGKCHNSRICLHTDFYTTAKRLSKLQYPDPAMVLRFNLFLAVCIAHEMAHFIEVSGPHHERPLGRPEVFFNDNTWTESGIAFELKVFGGRLHPISSRVDCSLGMAVLSYPLKELYDREENVLFTLGMDYIAMLQQKQTWEQDFSETNATFFHVPRNGSRSVDINGTNLMVWEDEADADISDHIDGQDTTFHRMDDGQIIKNPSVSNRKSARQPEVKRWTPYGNRQRKNTLDTACVSKELPDDDKVPKVEVKKETKEEEGGVGGGAGGAGEEEEAAAHSDEEML